ncbi:MAG TPA: dihydroorotase [Candidatus Baltobacteraceae bacterium]|nr:dihydroorotase [Candidatus Baltobacteraceae bacterium]
MQELKILRPDDFHVHLRQDGDLALTVRETASVFRHALVMPNLKPAVLGWQDVCDYVFKIQDQVARLDITTFIPLLTFQVTAATTVLDVRQCAPPICAAGKLYPAGVTTNSQNGVSDFEALYPVFAEMEKLGRVLCLHGETPGAFSLDREFRFLETLMDLSEKFPGLRMVLEHLSTAAAVRCIEDLPDNVGATITAHHLMLTLDDVIGDLLQPHHFCKPIPKRPEDRKALIAAATGGNPKFFFGSDSAPHVKGMKECAFGCAGVFSAPVAIPVLAQVFEKYGALDKLEGFTSKHGAAFYGLSPKIAGFPDRDIVTLRKEPWTVPDRIGKRFVPFMAGETLDWKLV